MKHEAGAGAGGPDGGRIPDIRHDPFRVAGREVAVVSPRLDHRDNARAFRLDRPDDSGPDEARGTGDDHPVLRLNCET